MPKKPAQCPTLFVWRSELVAPQTRGPWVQTPWEEPDLAPIYANYNLACPFCEGTYDESESSEGDFYLKKEGRCRFCGFWHVTEEMYSYGWNMDITSGYSEERRLTFSCLTEMNINDSSLGLDELGSHLRRRFDDIYLLQPRRFEELVADIYSSFGFKSRLTKQSRDGGYDIILLERETGNQIIVECKRYGRDRRVRVGTVRKILGVQLATGTKSAKIVTTTRFTCPAHEIASAVNNGVSGYDLELVDAGQLLTELEVYNTKLPPLEVVNRLRDC